MKSAHAHNDDEVKFLAAVERLKEAMTASLRSASNATTETLTVPVDVMTSAVAAQVLAVRVCRAAEAERLRCLAEDLHVGEFVDDPRDRGGKR